MAKHVDLELKKAFEELQVKMVETSKKIYFIDTQITALDDLITYLRSTQRGLEGETDGTIAYISVGRMFVQTDLNVILRSIKKRVAKLTDRVNDYVNNKKYLDSNLRDSEGNLREMVQQRKELIEDKTN